jgi:DNA-binding CsgD family transcriptional regulator
VTAPTLASPTALTDRQARILQQVADGDTYAEIADAEFMTATAVASTIWYVRKKLRATSTPNAVAIAYRKRIIT